MTGARVRGPRPVPVPAAASVSVLLPVSNRAPATLTCLHALAANLPTIAFEVVVIACRPSPDIAAVVGRLGGDVQVVAADDRVGIAGALDLGAIRADGTLLLAVHDDTIVLPGFLDPLLAACAQPDVGAAHPRLLRLDGQLDCPDDEPGARWDPPAAWAAIGRGPVDGTATSPATADAAPDTPRVPPRASGVAPGAASRVSPGTSGVFPPAVARTACLLVRADAVRQAGGFRCRPGHLDSETQLADRMRRAGWSIRYVPAVAVVHRGVHTTSSSRWPSTAAHDRAGAATLVGARSAAVTP